MTIKGSSELIESIQRELDYNVTTVPVGSQVSAKPLLTFAMLASCVNFTALMLPTDPVPLSVTTVGPVASDIGHAESIDLAATKAQKRQLQAIEDSLRLLPMDVLRQLPPHFRSVQRALQQSDVAATARQLLDWREAGRAEADVAEGLGEFARLASDIPLLDKLAVQADALSRSYAQSADLARFQANVSGQSTITGTGSIGSTTSSPRGVLPTTIICCIWEWNMEKRYYWRNKIPMDLGCPHRPDRQKAQRVRCTNSHGCPGIDCRSPLFACLSPMTAQQRHQHAGERLTGRHWLIQVTI